MHLTSSFVILLSVALAAAPCAALAAGAPAEARPAQIRIDGEAVTNPDFIGVGFHVFFPMHGDAVTPTIRDEVLHKRWIELQPSFVRLTHQWSRGAEGEQALVEAMAMMKTTATSVYLTTWDPKAFPPGDGRAAYAKDVADLLQRLRKAGCDNLRWYCMANELSMRGDIGGGVTLSGWAGMRRHKDVFADYHRLIHAQLTDRRIDVGLLAMDASPGLGIQDAQWARKNIDAISAVYGGHHYINQHGLDDAGFYGWFLQQCQAASRVAPDKPFLIGEFGGRQHQGGRYGYQRWDGCAYFDTPQEPKLALQIAEAIVASVNGGADAIAYWTFADFPDRQDKRYINKWGVSRWSGDDHSTRDLYYPMAQLTRNLRGPGKVLKAVSSDPLVRVACVMQTGGGLAIAVVNRSKAATTIEVAMPAVDKPLRRFSFDPARPPQHPFGDLPAPDGLLKVAEGRFSDRLPPSSVTVYTTLYDEDPPARVAGVTTATVDGRRVVRWTASADKDLAYYRVFAGGRQVGSTVATQLTLPAGADQPLSVRAVDRSGNVGP